MSIIKHVTLQKIVAHDFRYDPRIFIQQISVLDILNMLYNLNFFSSKRRLFHNATLFGFCITHILNTGVLKFEEKKIRRQKVNVEGGQATLCGTVRVCCVTLHDDSD